MPERMLSVATSLGEELLLKSMTGYERLSTPFEYRLTLLSKNLEIALEDVLGTEMTVTLLQRDREKRFFHGVVTEFAQNPVDDGHYAEYIAVLRPQVWLLTQTADCRIFQNQTAPDIVRRLLKEHGVASEFKLLGKYAERTYCVQYRETDFNFICRLLEDEGIYYHFVHQNGKHTFRAVDDMSFHAPISGYETAT